MTKPGPHLFDNFVAEMNESMGVDGFLLEMEQCTSVKEAPQVVIVMQPRSHKALVISTGWTGDDAWVTVTRRDTQTGLVESVAVLPMPDFSVTLT